MNENDCPSLMLAFVSLRFLLGGGGWEMRVLNLLRAPSWEVESRVSARFLFGQGG